MPLLGELSALLTACCWSGSALAFSAATVRVGPIRLNVTRLILASLLLFVTVVIAGIDVHLSSSQLRNLALSGIIGLVLGDSFLFKSYEYIGARLTMLIASVAPAISALLAYFLLGEVLSWLGVIGMFVTLIGVSIVVLERRDPFGHSQRHFGAGILYALLASAGQGVGLVIAKMAFLEGAINGFVASLVRIATAVVVILPVAKLAGRYENTFKVYLNDRKSMGLTLLGAFLGPYLGVTLSLVAISYTKVGIAATLMATVPIMMLPLVKYIQKEVLSWRAIVGAFVAVGGVAILFLR
jgi:drug/metabolite transporter (DMT)-like permease